MSIKSLRNLLKVTQLCSGQVGENSKVKLNSNTEQLTTVTGSYKTPYVIKAKHFHSIFWLSNFISAMENVL